MTSTIKLKKSSVSGNKPGTSDLEYGELAINFADGKLFYKNSSNQIRSFVDSGLVQSLSLDSSEVINLVDSAYVQARQTVSTFDSDSVTNLVDSAYVQDRQMGVGFNLYEYNATDNQTTFEDSDIAGNVLSYSENNILVHYNGVLLSTTEYTATDGSSVVLDDAADSGAIIMIARWREGGQDTASGSSGSYGGGSGSGSVNWGGDRGISGGGLTSGAPSTNTITYIDITTPGNAQDFGDLSASREVLGALSNGTRGVFGGGTVDTTTGLSNVMDYVTISTTGNAVDFGDLQSARRFADGASCNGTVGIFAGGRVTGNTNTDEIDKITPATTGNATDFGNMTTSRFGVTSFADATRGVLAGGYETNGDVTTEYITYATTGNASDFGDLTLGRYELGSVSDTTRGVVAGGQGNSGVANTIDYFTTQTTGDAVDFGDLTEARKTSGMSQATYGVFSSGTGASYFNTMDYITIQTTGNATDFGDNTSAFGGVAACSGSPS